MISIIGRNRSGVLALLALLAALPVVAQGPASAAPNRPVFPTLRVASGARGEAAIQALGDKLADVAAHYRKTPEELRALLREDRALRLDSVGRLYYVCELEVPLPAASEPVVAAAAPYPLTNTFLLHSRPGATKVIYMDFDGHTITGSAWNNGRADPIVAPPFDTDGNPGSFSENEQTLIQQVWQRVAEDFAAYDVDVTTEYPGEAAITRSSSGDQSYGTRALVSAIGAQFGSPGGIAYVGVYDSVGDYYKPALVFPEMLGNSAKNIAEALTHEVGHNLGLNHDGTTTGSAYYGGQGNWAPIMGVGYSKPITQWSKGEYANANNPEDDLAVITQNGLSYRTDDSGNSTAAATLLSGVSMTTNGIISGDTDRDFFAFTSGAGNVQVTVTPGPLGANLHLLVSLYNIAGTLITNRETADTGGGVQAVSFTQAVGNGISYLAVEGTGTGDPLTTGYSGYASLGQYTLNIVVPSDSTWAQTAGGTYAWNTAANWTAGSPNVADATARLNNNIAGDQLINLDSIITIGRLVLGDADSSHGFTIQPGTSGSFALSSTAGPVEILKATGGTDVITANIFLADPLIVSNGAAGSLTLAGVISGAQPLTKLGGGVLTLNGITTYSGVTTISNGTLALGVSGVLANSPLLDLKSGARLDVSAQAGAYALASGKTLQGSGAIIGTATLAANSILTPGATNVPGTITFSNNLTLSGARLNFDLAATNPPGGGTNDLVEIFGDLTLTGTSTLNFNLLASALASPASYPLFRYSGTLAGGATNFSLPANLGRYNFALDFSVPGEINLNVTGSPAVLAWRGDGSLNRWENSPANLNWDNAGGADQFQPFDHVTFDDVGSVTPAVNLVGALTPATVTVNAAANYTLAGSGKITGLASLTKQGSGTLTISSTNDFNGAVNISSGVLKVGNPAALGATNGATVVTDGGSLDLNDKDLGGEELVIAGAGAGGQGAIFDSGGWVGNYRMAHRVRLTANATIAAPNGRWDIADGSLLGNGFTLAKTGVSDIWLINLGDLNLGNLDIQAGTLGIQEATTCGNPSGVITVASGATLGMWAVPTPLNKVLVMNGGSVYSGGQANTFAGGVTLNGANTFTTDVGLELSGTVGGAGQLVKQGVATLTLSGNNGRTGNTTISAGTVELGDGGAAGTIGSGAVSVAANATLRQNRSDSVTFANPISGAGALEKDGAGVMNISTANSYSGGTRLKAGDLQVGNAAALGTGAVSVQTVTGSGRILLASGVNLTNAIVVGSANPGVGNGALSVSGNTVSATFSGPVTVNGLSATGGHIQGPTTAGLLEFTGPLTLGGSATDIAVRNGNVRFSGGGNCALLRILQGTTTLGAVNGIPTNAVLRLGGSGFASLNLNGWNQTLAGLNREAANSATVLNSSGTPATLSLDQGRGSSSFNGLISGNLHLALVSGSLELGGANSYTAGTTISGTLTVTNNGGVNYLGSGPLTFGNGTLKVTSGTSTFTPASFNNNVIVPTGSNATINPNIGARFVLGPAAGTTTRTLTGGGTLNLTVTGADTSRAEWTLGAGDFTGILNLAAETNSVSGGGFGFHFTGNAAGRGPVGVGSGSFSGLSNATVNFNGAGNTGITPFVPAAGTTFALGALNGGRFGDFLDAGQGGAVTYEIGALNTACSFAGKILGASTALRKSGTNTLALGGTNSYGGVTTINGGILTVASQVSQWSDAGPSGSGVNNPGNVSQATAGLRPFYLPGALNGKPVLDFGPGYADGTSGKHMAFNQSAATIRTVFWVIKGGNHLLGHNGAKYDFHRGGDVVNPLNSIWSSQYAPAAILNGATYLNGALTNGTTTPLPADFSIVSLVTTANVEANELAFDRALRSGGQQIAEIIVYNTALATAPRRATEKYLADKWGLPLAGDYSGVTALRAAGEVFWLDAAQTNTLTLVPVGNFSPASPMNLAAAGAVLDLKSTAQTVASLDGAAGSEVRLGSGTLTTGGGNFAGGISGSGNLVKTGGGVLTLSGTNTLSGGVTLNAGTLLVHGQLQNSGVSANSGTLGGNGVIAGVVSVNPGATISPGASIGKLTFGSSLTLAAGSTTLMEISKSPLTNDAVNVTGLLNLGGTLIVTNVGGGSLVAGDAFQLFTAGSFSGNFAAVTLPSLGAGLFWNTNQLATEGLLSVGSAAPPVIASVSVFGSNLIFSGTGGTPGGTYFVLTSTNVALPVANWTRILTNTFDLLGSFSVTNVINPAVSQGYYRIQVQ